MNLSTINTELNEYKNYLKKNYDSICEYNHCIKDLSIDNGCRLKHDIISELNNDSNNLENYLCNFKINKFSNFYDEESRVNVEDLIQKIRKDCDEIITLTYEDEVIFKFINFDPNMASEEYLELNCNNITEENLDNYVGYSSDYVEELNEALYKNAKADLIDLEERLKGVLSNLKIIANLE